MTGPMGAVGSRPPPRVLRGLLPVPVAVCETDRDAGAAADLAGVRPPPGATPSRRREFVTGRWCAARAMARLGVTPGAVGIGPDREPLWPSGLVGSITHCSGYRAAAVASTADVDALGIDAEPHRPMPAQVSALVLSPAEAHRLDRLPSGVAWATVVFSAKESAFKAYFSACRQWLDFLDVHVCLELDDGRSGSFTVSPTGRATEAAARELLPMGGRFGVGEHLVATAVTRAASAGAP